MYRLAVCTDHDLGEHDLGEPCMLTHIVKCLHKMLYWLYIAFLIFCAVFDDTNSFSVCDVAIILMGPCKSCNKKCLHTHVLVIVFLYKILMHQNVRVHKNYHVCVSIKIISLGVFCFCFVLFIFFNAFVKSHIWGF